MSPSIFRINPIFGLSIVRTSKLNMVRLDSLFSLEELREYKHWVIDVQGAELEVLKGAGDLLNICNSMRVEVSTFDAYCGSVNFNDLSLFLQTRGFIPLTNFPPKSHGAVIFIRSVNFTY